MIIDLSKAGARPGLAIIRDGGRRGRSLSKLTQNAVVDRRVKPLSANAAMRAFKIPNRRRATFHQWWLNYKPSLNLSTETESLEDVQAAKQCPQEGNAAFGFIPTDGWPFTNDGNGVADEVGEVADMFVARYCTHSRGLRPPKYTEIFKGKAPIRYRRGSNYGLVTNVPGSSKSADACLSWHFAFAKFLLETSIVHNVKNVDKLVAECLSKT